MKIKSINHKKVLHVEDQKIWRSLVEKSIRHLVDITSVATLVEAMVLLKKEKWDFVILDYQLNSDIASFNGKYLEDLVECPFCYFTGRDDVKLDNRISKSAEGCLKILKDKMVSQMK